MGCGQSTTTGVNRRRRSSVSSTKKISRNDDFDNSNCSDDYATAHSVSTINDAASPNNDNRQRNKKRFVVTMSRSRENSVTLGPLHAPMRKLDTLKLSLSDDDDQSEASTIISNGSLVDNSCIGRLPLKKSTKTVSPSNIGDRSPRVFSSHTNNNSNSRTRSLAGTDYSLPLFNPLTLPPQLAITGSSPQSYHSNQAMLQQDGTFNSRSTFNLSDIPYVRSGAESLSAAASPSAKHSSLPDRSPPFAFPKVASPTIPTMTTFHPIGL